MYILITLRTTQIRAAIYICRRNSHAEKQAVTACYTCSDSEEGTPQHNCHRQQAGRAEAVSTSHDAAAERGRLTARQGLYSSTSLVTTARRGNKAGCIGVAARRPRADAKAIHARCVSCHACQMLARHEGDIPTHTPKLSIITSSTSSEHQATKHKKRPRVDHDDVVLGCNAGCKGYTDERSL